MNEEIQSLCSRHAVCVGQFCLGALPIGQVNRAADILSRIREFSKKAPARRESLDNNEAFLDIISLADIDGWSAPYCGRQDPVAAGGLEFGHECYRGHERDQRCAT